MTLVYGEDETSFSQSQAYILAVQSIPEVIETAEKETLNIQTDTRKDTKEYMDKFFPKKHSMLPAKWEKFILSLVTFSIIAFICVFSVGAIVMEVFVDLGTVSVQINRFNVTKELEFALNNLKNESIDYDIECPANYIYSQNSIICSPACNHWDFLDDNTALLFETVLILFIDMSGTLLGILTLVSWPFVKDFWKFPQVTILFLVICLTLLTLVFSIVDLPGFYCGFDYTRSFSDLTADYQPYLMGAGAAIHYLRIAIMFWTIFTLFNIFISTLNPSTFNPDGKVKNMLILVECIISFGVPLVYIIVVLSLQINLFWNAFGYLPDYANTAVYMLGRIIPDYFTADFSLIFVALILTRLRFMSIDNKNLLGNAKKLSPLEIRLIIYCVVSSLVFYFFIIEVSLYLSLYEADISNLYNYRACLTLNSPLIETYGNTTVSRNTTSELLAPSDWNGGLECEGVKPFIDTYPPIWLSIYNICYRLIVNFFFLIFILKTNFTIWARWCKWVQDKLSCFKKSK